MYNPANTVEWQFFYTSSNDRALDFIKNFRENIEKFGTDDIEFTPRFVTWSCLNCDPEYKKKDCISNGKYCAMNHRGSYIQGKDIIMEDLREHCLFNNLKAKGQVLKWWEYMSYVHKMCYEEINEECSKLGHRDIG
jgi:hypothetical protein